MTYEFFKNGVFRDDEGYKRFPINTVFGPDWNANIQGSYQDFVTDPKNYTDFRWQPYKTMDECLQDFMSALVPVNRSSRSRTKETSTTGSLIRCWHPIPLSAISRP